MPLKAEPPSRSILCSTNRSTSPSRLEIPVPSRTHQQQAHSLNWPAPPTSNLDREGLKERVRWVDQIRTKSRNLSPRLPKFLLGFGKKCSEVVKGGKPAKDTHTDLKTIAVNGGMIRSRWEHEEGPHELIQALIDTIDTMIEERVTREYGDYLAMSLEKYRSSDVADMAWKRPARQEWSTVARNLEAEERAVKEYGGKRLYPGFVGFAATRPPTPISNDLEIAAMRLKMTPEQINFEIKEYAKRNDQCHSALKQLIRDADWHGLAHLIEADKSRLQEVSRFHPQVQQAMRYCIERIANKWFDECFYDGDRVCYLPSDQANTRWKEVHGSRRAGRSSMDESSLEAQLERPGEAVVQQRR
ncbi:MAG: hypothetical protein Q9216_004602 [Gyalolechia sp. 2 TL-2023]